MKQWNDLDVDFLICPANPSVASAHNESRYWGYTSVFNALDYSVVTLPVSTVQATDAWTQFPPASEAPLNGIDQWYRGLYKESGGYSKYKDAPISVQIVARRLQEEHVLEFARVIEELMRSQSWRSRL
jgi:amidase